MDKDFEIMTFNEGWIGIRSIEYSVGWIVTLSHGETRKDLLEWARKELPKVLAEREGIAKICPHCGKQFKVPARRGKQKYCSIKCGRIHKKGRLLKRKKNGNNLTGKTFSEEELRERLDRLREEYILDKQKLLSHAREYFKEREAKRNEKES